MLQNSCEPYVPSNVAINSYPGSPASDSPENAPTRNTHRCAHHRMGRTQMMKLT